RTRTTATTATSAKRASMYNVKSTASRFFRASFTRKSSPSPRLRVKRIPAPARLTDPRHGPATAIRQDGAPPVPGKLKVKNKTFTGWTFGRRAGITTTERSEEHTSELQ